MADMTAPALGDPAASGRYVGWLAGWLAGAAGRLARSAERRNERAERFKGRLRLTEVGATVVRLGGGRKGRGAARACMSLARAKNGDTRASERAMSEAAAHEKAGGGGDDEHAKRERAAAELVEKRLPTSRPGQPQPPPSHSTRLPAAHKEKRGSRDAL